MELSALGINIFGGGFTLGVRSSKKFDVLAQWEQCDAGRRTFDINFPGLARPLRRRDWDLLDLPHVNLLYANPPCAPWSAANTKLGMTPEKRNADPRLVMTRDTMETARAIGPDVFVLETVSRGYTLGRAYYDGWAEKWLADGYGVTYYLTDALLLGVPSTRQRFHFIAHRNDLRIQEPAKDFMPRTVGMAIADLMDNFDSRLQHVPHRTRPDYAEGMMKTPQGALLPDYCPKTSFLMRRCVWDAVGYTQVNIDGHLIHPLRPRFMTWREGMRLCGYPDTFSVHPSEPQAATQAVMPMVGRHLADIAAESVACGRAAQRELEIVDHRDLARPYRPGNVIRELESEI